MAEIGLSLGGPASKTLRDVLGAQHLDDVIPVRDSAACPVSPGKTTRPHFPFPDPSGGSLERWRARCGGTPMPPPSADSPAVPVA